MDVSNFLPYVAPDGNRIPVAPLMVALYHDAMPGLVTASRSSVDTPVFGADFNLTAEEMGAYLDDDPTNRYNEAVLRAFDGISYTRFAALRPTGRSVTQRSRRPPRATTIPTVVLSDAPVNPPGVNTGWDAQQYVMSALRAAGWQVYDVSRQRVGYDLLAQRGRDTRYIDVKSSLGYCTPSLTLREWQQAITHGARYILGVVENFDPSGQNTIQWVPDPAGACSASESTVVEYSISRGSWYRARVSIQSI
jgi:hypothetical protein